MKIEKGNDCESIEQRNNDAEENAASQGDLFSSDTDGKEQDNEGFVLYTRHGVQRLRKKRTSWARKPAGTDEDSQPSSSERQSKQASMGRGRGRKT